MDPWNNILFVAKLWAYFFSCIFSPHLSWFPSGVKGSFGIQAEQLLMMFPCLNFSDVFHWKGKAYLNTAHQKTHQTNTAIISPQSRSRVTGTAVQLSFKSYQSIHNLISKVSDERWEISAQVYEKCVCANAFAG